MYNSKGKRWFSELRLSQGHVMSRMLVHISDAIFQKFDYRYRPISNFIEIGFPIPDQLSLNPKFSDILPIFHFCYMYKARIC